MLTRNCTKETVVVKQESLFPYTVHLNIQENGQARKCRFFFFFARRFSKIWTNLNVCACLYFKIELALVSWHILIVFTHSPGPIRSFIGKLLIWKYLLYKFVSYRGGFINSIVTTLFFRKPKCRNKLGVLTCLAKRVRLLPRSRQVCSCALFFFLRIEKEVLWVCRWNLTKTSKITFRWKVRKLQIKRGRRAFPSCATRGAGLFKVVYNPWDQRSQISYKNRCLTLLRLAGMVVYCGLPPTPNILSNAPTILFAEVI